MREAFRSERDVPCSEGGITDCFPLVLCVSDAGEGEGGGELVEGEGEVELVFWVCGDGEGEFLVALAFEEARDLVGFGGGDGGEELSG